MIIGSHSYVFTDRWTDESVSLLDRMKGLGVECLDIGIGDDVVYTPELTGRRAAELGIGLAVSPGGLWPMECDLSSDDPEERKLGLAWHKRIVDKANALGATAYCGCMYGHAGVVKTRRPPVEEYEYTAEGMHMLAEYGEKMGVLIVVEPMSHFRTHVVNTPQQAKRLIEMSDHSNFGVLLDTYHMVSDVRDYAGGIRDLGDLLWGLHACENDRGIPGGGLVPWQAVFGALVEIGFEGPLIMETYNSSLGDFAFEHSMFHDPCPDPDEFIKLGSAFLLDCEARAKIARGNAIKMLDI